MGSLATTIKPMAQTVIDPVCGMKVIPGETKLVTIYKGNGYWFCAESCHKAFEANPERYLEPKSAKLKGPKTWWGRYLERLAKANKELFCDSPPRCH
jgi:YHS domain-containing protein